MRNLVTLTSAAAVLAASLALPAQAATAAPQWAACPAGKGVDPRQECATLKVPMDYSDPGGPMISLAISRIRTAQPGTRRGVLLIIPGGPGSPGLNRPSVQVAKLPQAVLDRFDVVGFDPRGVGQSSPVSCGLEPRDLDLTRLKPYPDADGGIAANAAWSRRIAEACARNGGPLIRHISTRNEARDIDAIRRALGEKKLSYWGVSYGTYAGAVYATMFPERTDRVILDSNDDPDPRKVARQWLANYAVGVEDRFPDFAAWAAARDGDYGLGADAGAVRRIFLELAARLDREPLTWKGANPPLLTGNLLRETMLNVLYSDAGFPVLAGLMKAARTGAELPPANTPPEAAMQNTAAHAGATMCNDVEWPDSISRHERQVKRNREEFPLTAGMPVNLGPCAYWPYKPAERPVKVGSRGPANVMLIQNLRDPSTPYSGALKMREAFGQRARMVSVDSGGHGVYLANGNACGDRAVTGFLTGGHLPRHDQSC
ncbi:alpha/beta hydrolase [Nonomuraea endophytica]|uniref:Pimeloyl-ACP methyl ester carboxylesterase n=1 Tax=Nonomuraea endophytica TaxID=714136 RepID=A0A7W8EIG5_9ACTN|nr:alpha/beta hydrolase [Nonomuraea endophytica]MBB5082000.1 pimeloyl-ACP methyl ester carboxylesterase [Nonomuraea endophytica]